MKGINSNLLYFLKVQYMHIYQNLKVLTKFLSALFSIACLNFFKKTIRCDRLAIFGKNKSE